MIIGRDFQYQKSHGAFAYSQFIGPISSSSSKGVVKMRKERVQYDNPTRNESEVHLLYCTLLPLHSLSFHFQSGPYSLYPGLTACPSFS